MRTAFAAAVHGITLGLGAATIAIACKNAGYFVCVDDGDCGGDASGTCEPVGACSFPDDACPSGRRYGDASTPTIAGECVELDGTSSGSSIDSSAADGSPATTEDGAGTTGPIAEGTTGDGCPAGWWDCAWSFRHRVTLSRPIGETLAGFSALVLLGPQRVEYARLQADGEDLRFVSADGNEAPYEVERWDPAGVSIVWVRLDEIGAGSDHFWIYYGNAVADGAPDASAVWPSPWMGVWHLDEELQDSTPGAHHAQGVGEVVPTSGQIEMAQDFLLPNARLDVAAMPGLADAFFEGGTVSAWMRMRGPGGGGFGRIVNKEGGAGGWMFYVGDGQQLRFGHRYVDPPTTWFTAGDVFALQTWTHVAVTFDATGTVPPRFWVDGEEVPADTPATVPMRAPPSDADVPLTVGNRPANDRSFDGVLDEIRIAHVIRSPAFIAADVASMRDELFTFGPLEARDDAP